MGSVEELPHPLLSFPALYADLPAVVIHLARYDEIDIIQINRIIEERIAIGKGPLGFLNYALYENSWVLNDITNGSNPGCTCFFVSCREFVRVDVTVQATP